MSKERTQAVPSSGAAAQPDKAAPFSSTPQDDIAPQAPEKSTVALASVSISRSPPPKADKVNESASEKRPQQEQRTRSTSTGETVPIPPTQMSLAVTAQEEGHPKASTPPIDKGTATAPTSISTEPLKPGEAYGLPTTRVLEEREEAAKLTNLGNPISAFPPSRSGGSPVQSRILGVNTTPIFKRATSASASLGTEVLNDKTRPNSGENDIITTATNETGQPPIASETEAIGNINSKTELKRPQQGQIKASEPTTHFEGSRNHGAESSISINNAKGLGVRMATHLAPKPQYIHPRRPADRPDSPRGEGEGEARELLQWEERLHVVPLKILRKRWRQNVTGRSGRELTFKQLNLLRADHDHKFHNFFQNIGAVATLGASITFLLIPVPLQPTVDVSKNHFFDDSQVRIFLAIAWLLFMIVIGLSIFFAGIVKDRYDIQMWDRVDILATALPYFFLLTAIIFLGLVVAAYVEVVGFITVGLTALVGLLIIGNLTCGELGAVLGGSGGPLW